MSLLQRFKPGKTEPTPVIDDEPGITENPFQNTPLTEPEDDFVPLSEGSLALDNSELDPELVAGEVKTKKRFRLPELNNPLGESCPLLAFQAGSFGLRGTLVRNDKHGASLIAVAESRTVDFTRAIEEILEQLKRYRKRLPKRAILLTPSVVTALVQLPVSPLRPRSNEQMQELIRWELEGALSQQNKHWMIGSMLVERGYLTAEQRDEIVEQLQQRQTEGGPQALVRFGDLAVQAGYINREQLEECFALQGKLISIDDDLVYGWQASEQSKDGLSDEFLLSEEEDNDSSHPWLVSGMGKTLQRRWIGAFNLNGIRLEAFYPVSGGAFAALYQHCDQDQQLLLEITQEQLCLVYGSQQNVLEITSSERQSGSLTVDQCIEATGILPSDISRLYICSDQNDNLTGLMQELSSLLNIEVQHFIPPVQDYELPQDISQGGMLAMLGSVNHYFQHVPVTRQSQVLARELQEAKWKRLLEPKFLKLAGVSAVIITMLVSLGWMYWNRDFQQARLDKLTASYERDLQVKQQLELAYQENLELAQSITDTDQELVLTLQLLSEVEADSGYRALSLSPLLKAVAMALPPDVTLQRIQKSEQLITLIVDAPSSPTAQEYAAILGDFVRPVGYQVTNSRPAPNSEQSSAGYQMEIQIEFKAELTDSLYKESLSLSLQP